MCDAATEVRMNEFRGPNSASTSRWVGAEAVQSPVQHELHNKAIRGYAETH